MSANFGDLEGGITAVADDFVPIAKPSVNGRCLREAAGWNRR
jgi:hypothetical protein